MGLTANSGAYSREIYEIQITNFCIRAGNFCTLVLMAETTSSDRQTPSVSASASGNQKTEKPRAKLALLTWFFAVLFCLIFGVPVLWIKQQQARQAAQYVVENEAQLGTVAIKHHLKLRHDSRAAAFSAVATRTRPADPGRQSWDQLVQEARAAGADLAIVVDENGALLAQDGAGAVGLSEPGIRNGLVPSGSLRALGKHLIEAFQIAVSSDGRNALLIAACRILPETLRQDGEPLGLGLAIALEGVFVTNLPADALTSGRWGNDPRETLHDLAVRYHLVSSPFWQGRLLVAVPLAKSQQWSASQMFDALLLFGLLAGALLLLATAVQFAVLSPLLRIAETSNRVAQGSLSRVRAMLKPFLDRQDEIAVLSKGFDTAVQRLQSLVHVSRRVLEDIEDALTLSDRIANSLASSAATQDDRSKEVLAAVTPMSRAIERLTRQMVEVRNAQVQISLAYSNADQAHAQVQTASRRADGMLHSSDSNEGRTYRTATLGQQLQLMTQALAEEREALNRIREHLTALRATVDIAMDTVGFDDTTGAAIGRSIQDLNRLSRQQNADADALRNGIEQLRRDSEKLGLLILAIQSKGGDDLSSLSGNYNLSATLRSRRTSDSAHRSQMNAPARLGPTGSMPAAASSQALRPVAMSSLPTTKSPAAGVGVGGASGERRVSNPNSTYSPRAAVSGSSPGLRPISANSSPGLRSVSASSQSLRPVSVPEGFNKNRTESDLTGKREKTGPVQVDRGTNPVSSASPKIASKPPADSRSDD